MTTSNLLIIDTAAELKELAPAAGTHVLLVGQKFALDGFGGFYRWDASENDPEDNTIYANVISSSQSNQGRWVRIFQKANNITQGKLVSTGGMKIFMAPGVTDANGQVTISLLNGTTPIFSEIWFSNARASLESQALTPENIITSVGTITSDLKTIKYGFFKPNPAKNIPASNYSPVVSVGSGVKVQIRVEGV